MKLKKLSEATFTRQVIAFAKLHGWRVAHFRPARTKHGWRTAVSGDGKGWPDLVMIRGDNMIVAELKVGSGRLFYEQVVWIAAFKEAGITTYVFRPEDWPDIERILE